MDLVFKILLLFVIVSHGYVVNEHTSQSQISSEDESNGNVTLRKNLKDCIEESKADRDIVLKLTSGKWKHMKKEPLTLKKWALCLLVRSGIMSRDGVLNQNVVLASIPKREKLKVERTIDKCLFKKSHPPPDIAWHYIRCFRYRYPKYSII